MRMDRSETLLLVAGVVVALAGFLLPNWTISIATSAFATALVVQGIVLLIRAGLVSFGQGLFFGIGGYAAGMSNRFLGITDVVGMLALGLVVAVGLAMVLGLLLSRYREIFFAMLTLAFSMILYGVLVKSQALGSTDGFGVGAWHILGWVPPEGYRRLSLFVLTVVIGTVVAVLLHRYRRSALGLACEAIRENEVRVEYMGISQRLVLYINYVIAAAVGALGGSLHALAIGHVDPGMTYWTTSGEFVFIALLAGSGHVAAPFIAALLFAMVRTYAVELIPNAWQMGLGITLLVIILFLPGGIWSLFTRLRRATS